MSADYNKRYNSSYADDEIDLGKLLVKSYWILKRRFLLLIIFGGIGLLAGFIFYFTMTPVYQTRMTVSSGLLTATNSSNMMNTLQLLIDEGSYEMLSTRLNISTDQARHLREISVLNVVEDEVETGSANLFRIVVRITDNSIIDPLEAGIVNYLENNNFVKRRIDKRRENLTSLINKLQSEMQELDSLKNRVSSNFLTGGNENANVVIMDPVNVYKEAIEMYQREIDLQTELEFVENIQIIEGFTIFRVPVSPRKRYIIYGMIAGILLGFFAVAFAELIDYSKKMEVSELA